MKTGAGLLKRRLDDFDTLARLRRDVAHAHGLAVLPSCPTGAVPPIDINGPTLTARLKPTIASIGFPFEISSRSNITTRPHSQLPTADGRAMVVK
ncbi:hypothetical protein [Nitratireductor arenosus]|uniref:hypothetical protein n=1 Tax=Nitratireductor arenosus TaxID=2682096 RepID=UPI0018D24BC2|nr:hypothetical protein [Nitratireductor arenosus]